jgi:hypothetical protein
MGRTPAALSFTTIASAFDERTDPAALRGVYLAEACVGDSELRREVEAGEITLSSS